MQAAGRSSGVVPSRAGSVAGLRVALEGGGGCCFAPAAEQKAVAGPGVICFYSPFLTLFVSEIKARFERASRAALRRENVAETRRRSAGARLFLHVGAMAKGLLPWQRPPRARDGSCLPRGPPFGSPSCSLLRFNLLVAGFS